MKRTCLGKIVSAHGVKGLVKIKPFGQDPSLIESLGAAFTSEDGDETLTVLLKNGLGKYILAEIEGSADRNSAEALRGTELFYERALLADAPEDSFYYDDLVGLKVMEDGKEIGKVIAVDNFGAGDLIEIKRTRGEEDFYLPFKDEYVPEVDIDGGYIKVVGSDAF